MKIFRYTITLIDPLFYSQEGLSGAVTPIYLHATTLNHAVAYALGKGEKQPYLITEDNGGRNTPRYKDSLISEDFYFTPARLQENPKYLPEIVKGELDGFVVKGYPGAEVLRASQLFSLTPELEFEGYCICKNNITIPDIIRLGSFRGKARLEVAQAKVIRKVSNTLVEHPVDPLVSKVSRGVMINMFPYPLLENAICEYCLELQLQGEKFLKVISLPEEMMKDSRKDEEFVRGDTIIF
jgi:CRISPR type I-D-associated protein Csc1